MVVLLTIGAFHQTVPSGARDMAFFLTLFSLGSSLGHKGAQGGGGCCSNARGQGLMLQLIQPWSGYPAWLATCI